MYRNAGNATMPGSFWATICADMSVASSFGKSPGGSTRSGSPKSPSSRAHASSPLSRAQQLLPHSNQAASSVQTRMPRRNSCPSKLPIKSPKKVWSAATTDTSCSNGSSASRHPLKSFNPDKKNVPSKPLLIQCDLETPRSEERSPSLSGSPTSKDDSIRARKHTFLRKRCGLRWFHSDNLRLLIFDDLLNEDTDCRLSATAVLEHARFKDCLTLFPTGVWSNTEQTEQKTGISFVERMDMSSQDMSEITPDIFFRAITATQA